MFKYSTDEVKMELIEEMMREDPFTELLPELQIAILSPPPPFLPVPGEPAIPWDRWQKSFEQYLEALGETNLADSSKCALLQNCLGHEGQRVYVTLVQDETSYAAAISTLTIHFSSCHNPQMCRFRFRQRAQRPGESVEQFVSALEELVKPCNYGDFEDEFILDQLIEKTNCMQLRERLLLEQNILTLARALIVGKQVEYALSQSASSSIQNMTLASEEASYTDNEDRPVQREVRGGRTRRSERLKELKPQETKRTSNICGHNKDNDNCSNDKQYHGEDESQTDDSNGNDGGIDDTEDEDYDDDAKDKDYEEGDDETDEDHDYNDANDQDDKVGSDKIKDEDYDDATDKDLEVYGNREVTDSKTQKKDNFCPICIDRSFRHASKLARHMRVHTKERPFKCPVCAMAFTQSYHMNRHLRNQHDGYNDANDKDYEVGGNETDEDNDCDDANDKDHEVGGDDTDENYNDAKDKDLEVDGNKEVTSLKTHKKEYFCLICTDRSFSHASRLARHMRVHTKEKPFSCPVCAMAFSHSYHMNRHLRNQHDGYNNAKDKDNEVGGDEMKGQHCDANDEDYDGAGDHIFSSETQKIEYSCFICTDRSFRHPSKLARHMRTHSKEKTFTCPVCDMTFSQSYHMTRHIKNKHSSGPYICFKCGGNSGSWAELETHNRTHARRTPEEWACPVCNNKFQGKRALSSHIKTHSRVQLNSHRLTCTVCAKRFNRIYHLKRHVAIHGLKPECHKFPDCQRSFPHLQDLKNHQEAHRTEASGREIGEKSYLCATCGKKFKFQYALENHELRHKEAPFYCSTCDKHFSELSCYERHQRVHVRLESKCPHCECVFRNKFKNHLRTHIKERPYQCSCCVESFTQKEDLELHCMKHREFKKEKPYSCTRCDYAFSSLEKLTAHMSSHKGEQPLKCPNCTWTFLNKSKLEKHMTIHTGERPYLCPICGRGYPSSTNLKIHMRCHTGEKPFKCSHCSKSYTSSSGLRRHSCHHMAVRPSYPCPHCGRTYGRLTELRMHQRYHTGDKAFVCNVCSKCFVSKHKLSVHMRIHTGERPYSCSQCGQTFTQAGDRNRHTSKFH